MTAWSRTIHEIYCNGRVPAPTPEDPGHFRSCIKVYEPSGVPAGTKLTPAALRRLAAADGWTHVRNTVLGRRYDKDFCPVHKPEGN